MMVDYDDDAEAACLQKLHDILLERPPGGRRRNDGPAEIVEHVYLGSMVDALDVRLLRRLRITHVLNCAPSAVRRYADSLRVPVDDCPATWLSDTTSSAEQRASGYNACRPLVNGCKLPVIGGDLDYYDRWNGQLLSDSCCYGLSIYDPVQSGVTSYMEIDADDLSGYPILTLHYGQARRFFEEARAAGGRALVHCELGVNRSAALAVAYLVDSERVTLTQAVRQVRIDRPNVLRNDGFRRQLVRFAAERRLLDRRRNHKAKD